jgi:hypothetical protein
VGYSEAIDELGKRRPQN